MVVPLYNSFALLQLDGIVLLLFSIDHCLFSLKNYYYGDVFFQHNPVFVMVN